LRAAARGRDDESVSEPVPSRRATAWVLTTALAVALMVAIGGYTRLTGSGLSITEWAPIQGALPPLGEAAWAEAFAKYQASPEYQKVNTGMSFEAFQRIFYVEWGHRFVGRLVGVWVLVPLIVLARRRELPRWAARRMVLLFVAGGVQAAMGWIMVKSGLVDAPHVSPVKLTLHLLIAFGIFVGLLWTWLELRAAHAAGDAGRAAQASTSAPPALARFARAFVVLVFIVIASGGLMAGTKAGWVFADFPTMNGEWWPTMAFRDGWRSPMHDPVSAHALHRALALSLVAIGVGFFAATRRLPPGAPLRVGATWVLVALAVQLSLGVATVMSHVALPIALTHQLGGLAVLAMATVASFRARRAG
jgi:cytochrome c oxidase assembly protein subunit 15